MLIGRRNLRSGIQFRKGLTRFGMLGLCNYESTGCLSLMKHTGVHLFAVSSMNPIYVDIEFITPP